MGPERIFEIVLHTALPSELSTSGNWVDANSILYSILSSSPRVQSKRKGGINKKNESKQLAGYSSGVPPKRKKGTEENETAQPADLDESASFKPGTISQDDVLLIAHELGSSWEMVGRVLKVPDAVIDQIEADTDKVSKKCYRVLRRWQEMYPSNATYHRLARALKHPAVGRVDLVDKYCGLQLGTSSAPETTAQGVEARKRKRKKNFTASDEEEYDVDEGEESIEEEKEEEDQPHESTKKKEKKTGKVSKLLVDLVNDASDSLKKICNCFDTPLSGLGNYEDVAKYYHYDIFTIQARFKTSPDGPSKALILAMIGEHPRVTVENFARVVEKQAKRKDVAILLREFDCK